MWHSTALTATVLALASWIVLCLLAQPPRIEEALRHEAARALEAAGLRDVRPVFSGRDAALEGLVATPARLAEAERAVAGVSGVRAVENHLTVREDSAESSLPFLEIRTGPDGVTLRGSVPNEALRLELLDRARQTFGTERVDEQLVVDALVEEGAAMAGAAEVAAALAEAGDGVKVRLRGDSLRLSGEVASAEVRRRLEDRVRVAVPESRLFFSSLRVAGRDQGSDGGN